MAVFTNELKLDAGPFLDTLKKTVSASSAAADQVEAAFKGIKPTIDPSSAKAGFEQIENVAKTSAGNVKAQFAEGFKGLGSSITGGIIGGGVAAGVQAGAQAIVGAFKAVIDVGSEYEQNIAGLQAITGASGPVLDDLSERARNLAKEFGGSASTQVQSFQTILSKFGPALADSPEALGTFSTNVNVLAKAAGLDAKQAVDALSNSMLQFGVDASDPAKLAEESGRFINVLAASAKVGAAEIPQVAEAILQAGVAAKGANLSFEETNAAIQVLAVGGKVGSEAGVGLRNVLGLIQKASGPAAEQLKAMGLSTEQLGATLTTKGLGAALGDLQNGFQKLGTDAEKNAALMKIFGTENSATAGILLGNVKLIGEFTTGVTATQEAFEQAKINMATFGEFVSRVQANIEDFGISIFNAFSEVGKAFSQVLGPIFSDAADSIGDAFSAVLDYIKPVLAVIGGLIYGSIVIAFQNAAAVVKTVFGIIARIFESFSGALQPVRDAIANVFGSGGELDKGVDVVQIFQGILSGMGEVLSMVSDVVIEVGGFVAEFLVIPFQILTGIVAGVISKFREWFGSQKETNKETEKGKGILDTLREAFNNIRGTISGVTFAFREIKTVIGDFFNALSNFDLKGALAAFAGAGERVAGAYNEGFAAVAKNDAIKAENKKREEEYDKLLKNIKGATEAAANQTEATAKKVRGSFTEISRKLLNDGAVTRDQFLELSDLISKIQAGVKGTAEGGAGGAKSATEEAIKKANELFAIREAILKTEQETATTAILRQGLDKDAEKVSLKKLELETQKKLTQEYIKAFGAVTQLDDATGQERVVSVGFKVDNKNLADINTKVQNFFQQEIRLQAELALKPEELEKTVGKSIKFFEESFKKNAKDLAESVIDPVQFSTAVEGLRGSFTSLKTGLEDALKTPEVQASPALLAAYEEQILLVNQKLAEFNLNAVESLDKANIEGAKRRIELNRLTLKSLETDETANADEILRIRRELIDQETNLKLASLKSTGELRNAETKIILDEAAKQRAALDKNAKGTGGAFDSVVGGFTQAIAGLDFTGAFDTLVDAGTEAAEKTVDALKAGTLDYQSAVAELESITVESTSFLDTVLQRVADSFAKIRDASIASLRDISTGFDGSQQAIEKLINATANAAAAGFAQILLEGESFGKGFVLLILDILDATIPALVALILGQSLAANPLLGAVVSAALIATLKAAVAVARSAAQGFESGGYTGNVGTKDVAGVVHGQEFVINARATKQFRPMLEEMNKGRLPIIDNGEFSAMRAELSAIRRRLDGMPNGIQGSQAMQLNVGFDNYIYERDRRRSAVRGLRG